MQKSWELSIDGTVHTIEYMGSKFPGILKVSVDGRYNEYSATLVKKDGMFARFSVGNKDILLRVNGKNVDLAVDGVYVDAQTPVSESVLEFARRPSEQGDALQKRGKNYYGAFFSLVILTYINLALIILNASVSFPFSAMFPQIPLYVGQLMYEDYGSVAFYAAGTVISLICASALLLLYVLAKKRTTPVLLALIIMVIDTVILILMSLGNVSSILIDFLFHCWIIWSLLQLLLARRDMKRQLETTEESNTI